MPQTSSSAFASSGFGALASSSTSPFATIGASKPSVFGGSAQPSGFGALSGAKSPVAAAAEKPATGGFGSGFGSTSTSGFGGLNSGSVFGSALGNGFAGASGQKLSSFAAPGTTTAPLSSKPVKPFGAPEADEEDGSDEDDSEAGSSLDEEDGEKVVAEEKKKPKIPKGMHAPSQIHPSRSVRPLTADYSSNRRRRIR